MLVEVCIKSSGPVLVSINIEAELEKGNLQFCPCLRIKDNE